MNRNVLVGLVILLSLGCKQRFDQYKVSDKYAGPCVIFIMPNDIHSKEKDVVTLEDGFGVISEFDLDRNFVVKSIETGKEIRLVQTGKEKETNFTDRYVFRPGIGHGSSNCNYHEIHSVRFFVGKRAELEAWDQKYWNELEYFESTGRNWCAFYRKYLEIDSVNN